MNHDELLKKLYLARSQLYDAIHIVEEDRKKNGNNKTK